MSDLTRIVFLDTETTGLDERVGCLLEVAYIVTDLDLHRLGSDAHRTNPERLAYIPIDPIADTIHQKSGLWDHIRDELNAGVLGSVADVESAILLKLEQQGAEPRKTVMAGFSVHFDWRWLRVHMPRLCDFFYYRLLDLSAIYAAQTLWGVPFPKPVSRHRAMFDVEDCFACAQRVRQIFLALKSINEAQNRPFEDALVSPQ